LQYYFVFSTVHTISVNIDQILIRYLLSKYTLENLIIRDSNKKKAIVMLIGTHCNAHQFVAKLDLQFALISIVNVAINNSILDLLWSDGNHAISAPQIWLLS